MNLYTRKCIVPSCCNRNGLKSGETGTVFKFPSSEYNHHRTSQRLETWCRALNITPEIVTNLKQHVGVCFRHFRPVHITITPCKTRLSWTAIPELYLNENPDQEMGNNNTTSKIIEISDSDNEDELSQEKSKETNTREVIVENPNHASNDKKSTINSVTCEENIIIDSDDEPVENKIYYQPEFINIESLKKPQTKISTVEPNTEIDKNKDIKPISDKPKSNNVVEQICLMETDDEKGKQVEQSTSTAALVTETVIKLDPEIIDLDNNDVIECVEESKTMDTTIELKDKVDNVIHNIGDSEEKNEEELPTADNLDTENEPTFDVFVLDKNYPHNTDETAEEMDVDESETAKDEIVHTLVKKIIPEEAKPESPIDTNTNKTDVDEEVIDLDDSGDSDTLADDVNELNMKPSNDKTEQIKIIGDPVHIETEDKYAEVDENLFNAEDDNSCGTPANTTPPNEQAVSDNACAEENVLNLNDEFSDKSTNDYIANTTTSDVTINADNIQVGNMPVDNIPVDNIQVDNTHATDDNIIDLDANDNEATETTFHNNSDKQHSTLLALLSAPKNKEEEILQQTNIETDVCNKSPDVEDQKTDDIGIICLDDNDTDDNKLDDKPTDCKVDTQQAIENDTPDSKAIITENRGDNLEHVNDVSQLNDDEMVIDHQIKNADVIDVDLDTNANIDTPQEIENEKPDSHDNVSETRGGNLEQMINVDQSKDEEMEIDDQTKDADVINLNRTDVCDKSPDIEEPKKEDDDIICLDGNDTDEKSIDCKVSTPQAIENETPDSTGNVTENRSISLADLSNVILPKDGAMETDHHTKDVYVVDLDRDINEVTVTTQCNANNKEENNLEEIKMDSQSNNMEVEVQPDEQKGGDDEVLLVETNDNKIEVINQNTVKNDITIIENEANTTPDIKDGVSSLHECVNYHCSKTTTTTWPAPLFVLSFYRINKKSNKRQFVCEKCYDDCVMQYEQMAGDIMVQKAVVFKPVSQPDLIELSDSDDDEPGGVARRKKSDFNMAPNYIENNESNRIALGNLDDLIEKAFSEIKIDMQLKKRTDIINKAIEKNEITSTTLLNEIRDLQKSADKMHFTLYQKYPNRIIKELPPIDLNKEDSLNLPPLGDITYPPVQTGKRYLAPRHVISGPWVECETLEMYPNHPSDARKFGTHCKVIFCRRATKLVLNIKHLAYMVPPDVRLNVGTRVVAIFQQVPIPKQSFFPGTVGETLKDSNKYRYLIFFDDGYCQYVKHDNVRLICEVSADIWDDIDGNPGTSRFIQEFLTQFRKRISRPMLLAKRGQKIVTEFNGIWKLSKVVDVDCNLIKMYIEKNQTFEWIYRGSSRFAPIFKHRQIGNDLQLNVMNYHLKKRNEPYIEMTLDEISDGSYQGAEAQVDPKGYSSVNRAVARKSTNQGSRSYSNSSNNGSVNKAPVSLNNSVIVVDDDKMPKGKVTYYETTKRYSTATYVSHKCSPSCLVRVEDNLEPFNPIARPLLSGWERQICKYKSRKIAIYRAPCGRRLRTMLEIHRYLRLTNSPLNVECFDYDTTMHCLAEYTDLPQYIRNTDLSDGTEKMPISCCNYFDKTTPPTCTYSTNRIPTDGVNLNLDPDFLCACDCEDDCIDKSKCQCWQLTIKGARSINSSLPIDEIGYCFKRLLSPVPTGIYECNSRCKCKQNCLNRVVQHPLSVKLQVFKTTNRGWGLRTLHDIPKGSFICIYAGDLLTEQSSNELGAKEGDEYFAELDYIEAVEGLKEGYESDIPREEGDDEPEGERDEDFENSAESDDDDFTSKCKIDKKITTRSSTRSSKYQDSKKTNSSSLQTSASNTPSTPPVAATPSSLTEDDDCITISDDEEVRAPVNFIPNTSYDDDTEVDSKYKSVRKLFGKDELGYVMDAKRTGNIGRYFNHSCNPNLFVQNVFVDTHDLRFPWVTFFSNTSIQAGTELTWNYNYDVGCVPGKVLYCQCDSSNCRGRLL